MKEDLHKLHQELHELPSPTADSLWNLFKRRITGLMDKHIPSKILKGQKVRKPWVDKKVKAAIRKKARLYKRMKRSKNIKDIRKYRHCKYVLKRVSFGSKDCTKELKLECVYFLGQTS